MPRCLRRTWIALRSRWIDPLRARWALAGERRLLRRGPDRGIDAAPLLFFSLHRSGSSFLHRLLRSDAEALGYRTANLERYCVLAGRSLDAILEDPVLRERTFGARGYYYGVFRSWRPIPDLDEHRILLLLRDPRDVLTSQYYSLAYGHRMMSASHYDRRQKARRSGIDAFVLDRARSWRGRYRDYLQNLVGRPNVLRIRYEDLLRDFPGRFRAIRRHLGLSGATLPELPEDPFRVVEENPRAHKRQVAWGDFRDKLQAHTVRELNRTFADELDELGYPVGGAPLRGSP